MVVYQYRGLRGLLRRGLPTIHIDVADTADVIDVIQFRAQCPSQSQAEKCSMTRKLQRNPDRNSGSISDTVQYDKCISDRDLVIPTNEEREREREGRQEKARHKK